MTNNKASSKYQSKLTQNGDIWHAQITRQVTSKKVHISKEQGGFQSEVEAQKWADENLAEFIGTQKTANQRQSDSRKLNEETKRLRSERRAIKTEEEKLAKERADNAEAMKESSESEEINH